MLTPIGGYDVVTGLRAAVIAHDKAGFNMPDKEVGQQAFSGVPEAKINDDICAQGKDTPNTLASLALFRPIFSWMVARLQGMGIVKRNATTSQISVSH
jgi:hypothetical protein